MSSEKGCLDKATYCGLSPRVTALGRHKGAVYSLFETYMKMKAQRREYDAADRYVQCHDGQIWKTDLYFSAHAIIRRFREKAFPGETVDNVYVTFCGPMSLSTETCYADMSTKSKITF